MSVANVAFQVRGYKESFMNDDGQVSDDSKNAFRAMSMLKLTTSMQ